MTLMPDPMAIGKRIRARRDELGLTVRKAAPRCGISYQALSAIENGANTTFETLRGIAEGLGTDMEFTMGGTGSPSPTNAIVERFRAILPHLPQRQVDVIVHELEMWEEMYAPKKEKGG